MGKFPFTGCILEFRTRISESPPISERLGGRPAGPVPAAARSSPVRMRAPGPRSSCARPAAECGLGSQRGGRGRGGRRAVRRGGRSVGVRAVAARRPCARRRGRGGRPRNPGGLGRPGPSRRPALPRPPRPPAARRGSEEMPTQRDSSTMSHTVAGGGGGDHSHQVRVKAYYRG